MSFFDGLDDARGDACDDGVCGDGLGDDGTRRNDAVVAYGHARKDGRMRSDPNIFPHRDGVRDHAGAVGGVEHMVKRCEHHLMPDERAVADGDPSLILKQHPELTKTRLPNVMFFPKSV